MATGASCSGIEAGFDRDGRVVEDRAEWGVGIESRWSGAPFRALAPSPGGTQMGSRSGSISHYRPALDSAVSFQNLSFFLYEMGRSAGPQNR